MNLARFNGAIWELKSELENLEIPRRLDELHEALTDSMSMQTAEAASTFNTRLASLSGSLKGCASNEATPSRRRVLSSLGATDKTGLGLLFRINSIIQKNAITPAAALEEIELLSREVRAFQESVVSLGAGLDYLDVEYDELDANETEFGITIPESVLHGHIENYQNELACIDELARVLSEVATKQVQSTPIRTIGSTDLEVFLKVGSTVAACVVVAIERIVALYKKQLEIRKLKLEIEQLKMPDKVSRPFDEHVKELVGKELGEIAKDLLKQFYRSRGGRRNELEKHLKKVLAYVAERIDRGGSFEVRTGLPEEPEHEEDDEVSDTEKAARAKELKEFTELRGQVVKLNELGRSVGTIDREDEGILLLPEPYEVHGVNPEMPDGEVAEGADS